MILFKMLMPKMMLTMGGGGNDSPPPAPAAPAPPTVGQSMADYVKHYPKYAEQQMEYAPKFARTEQAILEELYPKTSQVQEDLVGEYQTRADQGFSPEQQAQYLDMKRAQLGSNVASPIGADNLSRGYMLAEQGYKDQALGNLAALGARAPIVNQQVDTSGFTPQGVMGFNSQNYGTQMSGHNALLGYQANTYGSRGSTNPMWGIAGSLAGGAFGMFG